MLIDGLYAVSHVGVPADLFRTRAVGWGVSLCLHLTAITATLSLLPDPLVIRPSMSRIEFRLTDNNLPQTAPTREDTAGNPDHVASRLRSRPSRNARSFTQAMNQEANPLPVDRPHPIQHAAVSTTDLAVPPSGKGSTPLSDPLPSMPSSEPAEHGPSERPMSAPDAHATSSSPEAQIAKSLTEETLPPSHTSAGHPHRIVDAAQSSDLSADLAAGIMAQQTLQTEKLMVQPSEKLDAPNTMPPSTVATSLPSDLHPTLAQPHYGWLTNLLKRRIISMQAYPRLARLQGWEGMVVVKATITNDGHLVEAVITKSSGYPTLDGDAVSLMHQVCPIHLPHDLGQSHIELFVPIHYRLER